MARVEIGGTNYVTKREVLVRGGWTDRMVGQLLGDCDRTCPNLHDESLPGRSRLYALSRVVAVESTDAFRAAQRASWTRRARQVIELLEQAGPRDRKIVERWLATSQAARPAAN